MAYESEIFVDNTTYALFGSIVLGSDNTRFDYENKEFDSELNSYDLHFRQHKH